MNALVLGAGGAIGSAVVAAAPRGARVRAASRATLDITCERDVARALEGERLDWVVNCAGWTRVDDAERHEEEAERVNTAAVGVLGRLAAVRNIRVLHLSTDYVFDGALGRPYTEGDTPNPLNAYGRTKLGGERALEASGASWLMVRTQWVYGERGSSFPRTMWERARRAEPSRVVNDQRGAPTTALELAAALWALVAMDARGIVHVAAAGEATRFDVARAVYARAGREPLVTPCGTDDWPTPARRPSDARLDGARYEALTRRRMRPWQEPLGEFLDRLERP